ncbi:hypothetical protein BDW69DRAFT_160824 [Aspergillus filifer]
MPRFREAEALGSNASTTLHVTTKPKTTLTHAPTSTHTPNPNHNSNNTLNSPCKSIEDCSSGLFCVNFKCMMPRGSEAEAFLPKANTTMTILPITSTSTSMATSTATSTATPSPSPYASHTLNQPCKSIEDCSAGLFCIDGKCMMPRGTEGEALGPNANSTATIGAMVKAAPDTLHHICNEAHDCSPGLQCVDHKCRSEGEVLGRDYHENNKRMNETEDGDEDANAVS